LVFALVSELAAYFMNYAVITEGGGTEVCWASKSFEVKA
jgi:hypothetical protein